MKPVAVLEAVHARDAAGPRGAPRGVLTGVSLGLDAGVHAVLGAPEDGTLALLDVLTGVRRPQRGRVTLAGLPPSQPAVRARMGVLAAEPRLPAAATVRDAVRLAMRARGESGDGFDAVIDPLGLSPLHGRDPRALSFAEERAVELALALSTPAPVLVALHEPLADVAIASPSLLAPRLRQIAAAGACVIVTTSSAADARALGDQVLVLHRGAVARKAPGGEGLGLPGPIELTAWVRDGARALAAALAKRPEVLGVSWEEASGDTAWPAAAAVRVRGDDAEACALALADAVVEAGVEIEGIEQRAPDLREVRTATETLWRMARARATAPAAPAPPTAPATATATTPATAPAPGAAAEPTAAPAPGASPAPDTASSPDAPRDALLPGEADR